MRQNKRVLIYAPAVGRGGIRRVIERLCKQFGDYSGWTFDVLGQRFDELGEQIAWPEGVKFMQIRPVDKLPLHPQQFDFLMKKRGVFFEHLKEVAGNYDVVFCPSAWWAFIGNEPIKTPVVSFVPDFAFDYIELGEVLGGYFRGISSIIARHSAHTVFPSHWQREWGEERYGFVGSTIYFSTDIAGEAPDASADNLASVRLRYGLPESYVLAFHCYGHKGAEVIIRAQEYARRRSRHVPPLVIAGLQTQLYLEQPATNEHTALIRQTIKECAGKIGRDVFILGPVSDDDMHLLHAGALAAVSASRSEGGLSGTILEAIRAGTPVISTDLPPIHERLSGEDVSYFPVDDAQALGECILQVVREYDWALLRAAQLKAALNNYTICDVADQYIEVFEGVLGG